MRKETYKKVMNKIKLPLEKKEEIYKNILERESKKKSYFKPIFVTTVVFVLMLLGSLGFAYAEEIEIMFNTMTKNQNKEKKKTEFNSSAVVEVNYDANISEMQYDYRKNPFYTYDELETIFGIPFLKSDYFGLENLYPLYVRKKKNKIAEVSFSIDNYNLLEYRKLEDDNYHLTMSFITKYADQKKNQFLVQGPHEDTEYYIEALKTKVYIANNLAPIQTRFILFDYCGVHYNLYLRFSITKSKQEADEETIRILESLYL